MNINDRVAISPVKQDVRVTYNESLGLTPMLSLEGTSLQIWQLNENFEAGPPSSRFNERRRGPACTSLYLGILEIVLLADKSGNEVRLFLSQLLRDFVEIG